MVETPASQRSTGVHDTLQHVIAVARHDLPFATRLAEVARTSTTLEELERALQSLYRLAVEHGDSFLADLVDGLLRHVEQARDSGVVGRHPWRDVL